jgi:hypothetical protein
MGTRCVKSRCEEACSLLLSAAMKLNRGIHSYIKSFTLFLSLLNLKRSVVV